MIVIEPRLHPVVVLVGAMVLAALILWLIPRQHRLWAGVLLVTGLPTLGLFWLGTAPQAIHLDQAGLVVTNHLGTPVARYRMGELAEVTTDWEKHRGRVLVMKRASGPVPTFVLNLPESRLAEVGSAVAEHMGLKEQEPLRRVLSR